MLVSISFAVESTLTFKGGVSQADTDIDQDKQLNGMIGLSYEIWMTKWLSLGLHPYVTRVQAGEKDDPETSEVIEAGFKSDVVGADLLFRLRPNWKKVAPYLTVGGGIVNYFPTDLDGHRIPGDYEYTAGVAPAIGAGITFFTKYDIDFDLGFQKNFMMSDYLEGWEYDDNNDSYWMAFLGVSHTFGKKKPEPVVIPEPVVVKPVVIPDPILNITPSTQNVSSMAGKTSFNIEANNPWTVSENEMWLTVNPAKGTGNGMLDIMYEENPTYKPRTGKIYVSGGGLNLTLTVMQEAKPLPPLVLKPVYFEFDKHVLTEEAMATLDEVLASLIHYPDTMLEIQGHTDNIGPKGYNQKLSVKRAEVVKEYLVSKGIDAMRLSAVGYGETMPIVANDSKDNRAMNRRAELAEKQ
jgi:OOP family OmpA-OmpF porin